MLNSWHHDKACRFTMFWHFIPAKETNQSGFRSLGTSECLSFAKCKWWIAARRFETRRDERKWGGQGVHMFWKLSDIHGPWLHALDDSLGSQTSCTFYIVLYCSAVSTTVTQRSSKYVKVAICILRQALLPQTNQQLSATLNWWSTTPDAFARAEVESHIIQIICMTGCSMFVHRAAGQMDKLDTLDWVHASMKIDLCWNSWNYLKHKAVLVNRQGPLCLLPMGSITGCMLRHPAVGLGLTSVWGLSAPRLHCVGM